VNYEPNSFGGPVEDPSVIGTIVVNNERLSACVPPCNNPTTTANM
jgi:hypothetical protein